MKKINIYLVANEKELLEDEKEISNFIGNLNNKYEESNLYFKLITDEDVNEQNEEEIKNSELFFIMFCKEIEENTINKFEIAYKNFQDNKNPKISTYIKKSSEQAGKTVIDFMQKLDEELGHFYTSYESVDTIKLNIILKLKTLGLALGNIEAKDGVLYVNEREMMSLEKIPIIFNNKELTQLKKEAEQVENNFWDLKEQIDNNKGNKQSVEEFETLKEKRTKLKQAIYDLEKNIIDLQTSFIKISTEGSLSRRQVYAQRCLEEGNIEAAKEALSLEEITKEANQLLELQNSRKTELKVKVNELIQRAETLLIDKRNNNRFEEIEKTYEETIRIEKEGGLYRKATLLYAKYLYNNNEYEKAIELGKKFIAYVEAEEIEEDLEDMHLAYEILSISNVKISKNEEAEKFAEKEVETAEKMQDDEMKASIYFDVAKEVYEETENFDKGIEYYQKAIVIYEKNEASDYISNTYGHLGRMYIGRGEFNEAEKCLEKAIEIAKKMLEKNPDYVNKYFLHALYYSSYVLYNEFIKDYEKAGNAIIKSLEWIDEVYREKPREQVIAESSEQTMEKFQEYIANMYIHRWFNRSARKAYRNIVKKILKQAGKFEKITADIYINEEKIVKLLGQENYQEAEPIVKETIKLLEQLEKIYQKENNRTEKTEVRQKMQYLMYANEIYGCAGVIYENMKQYENAEEHYKKSLEFGKELTKYGEVGLDRLSDNYSSMADLYKSMKQKEKAEEYYKKAIEIEEKLQEGLKAKKNLSNLYNKLANIYYDNKETYEEAEKYYKNSIEIAEEIADGDINKKIELRIYVIYRNLANLYSKMPRKEEAEKCYKKAIEIEEKSQENLEIKKSLAKTYNELANLYYSIDTRYEEAEEYYRKSIELKEKIAEGDSKKKIELGLDVVYNNLANLYDKMSKNEEAEEYRKKSQSLREGDAKNE